MKLALLLAYDGTGFWGFARQPSHRTVQGELDRVLSGLLHSEIRTTGAGRTDRGVHASGQVVSFDAPERTDPAWVIRRVNRWIAPEISVRAAARVPEGFDARFGATRRTYEYRLYRDPTPDPFLDRFALHEPEPLDLRAMRAAGRALLGERDFASFCRGEGRPTVRRIQRVSLAAPAPRRLTLTVAADSFCQQMVRSIAGALLAAGRGRIAPEDMPGILAARSRAAAPSIAPAKALHLVEVRFGRDPFASRHGA